MDALQKIADFIAAQKKDGKPLRSERALSLKIGSQSCIQNWRYGNSRPRLESAEKLADLLQAHGLFPSADDRERFVNSLLKIPVIRKPRREPDEPKEREAALSRAS